MVRKLSIKESINKFDTICYSPYFEDDITFEDFILTMTNEADFYRQTIYPTITNLQRKVKSGRYDDTLALKAWQNVADSAVKWYDKHYGSGKGSLTLISKSIRAEIAQAFKDRYDEDVYYKESLNRNRRANMHSRRESLHKRYSHR